MQWVNFWATWLDLVQGSSTLTGVELASCSPEALACWVMAHQVQAHTLLAPVVPLHNTGTLKVFAATFHVGLAQLCIAQQCEDRCPCC